MKQEISALMDGELFEDEAESLLNRVKCGPEARTDWELYHLIGDVLRQPDHVHSDLSAKVRERMKDEPTVLAPRGRAVREKIRTFAVSLAASLSAVGVVAWMSLQVGSEAVPTLAAGQNTVPSVSAQISSKANDYLMAHQEFSPSTDMNGGALYIRTVSYRPNEK